MKTSYSSSENAPSSRVNELPSVSATMLKNSYAEVLDQVSESGAVAVTRHNKPRAVLLSVKDYEALLHAAPDPLHELKEEYERMFLRMQTPEHASAMERLFKATPEELGAAAVKYAKRQTRRK